MSRWLAVFALWLGAGAAAAAADCPLLKAVYEPVDQPEGAAYAIRHVARDVGANQARYVLRIHDEKRARAYDFSFAYANGYGGASVVFAGEADKPRPKLRDRDPGSAILYFDAKLAQAPTYADPDAPAPAYLLLPEIGRSFWYWDKGDRTFVPPAGMWRQAKCE